MELSSQNRNDTPITGYIRFPLAVILEVTGRDAQRYLQSRLTNDIRALTDNTYCLAAALTPQGKTLGLFTVKRIEGDRYLLASDGGDPETIIAAVKQFLVADRVTVTNVSLLFSLVHYISETTSTDGLNRNRVRQIGYDQIESIESSSPKGAEISWHEYQVLRFRAGRPTFPEEINEKFLFSESGLMEAVSFMKGCYVGQEVVHKIDAYGKIPKRLVRGYFSSEIEIPAGSRLELNGDLVGKTVSSIIDKENHRTLCFASIDSEVEPDSDLLWNGNICKIL